MMKKKLSPQTYSVSEIKTSRVSRFRSKGKDSPTFSFFDSDTEILIQVWKYRYLTTEMLSVLTERSQKTLWRRLRKLFDAGYLGRIPFQKGSAGRPSTVVHVLLGKGASKVSKLTGQKISYTPLKNKNRDYQMAHHLMVSHFRVALETACKHNPDIELLGWKERVGIRRSVTVTERDKEQCRYPIAPDGFFGIRDLRRPEGKNRFYFFFEADRSTMSHATFQKKLKGYKYLWLQKKSRELYGIRTFRVLTLVEKKIDWQYEKGLDRLSGLTRDACAIDSKHELSELFYFSSLSNIQFEGAEFIFQRIWHVADKSETFEFRSLIK